MLRRSVFLTAGLVCGACAALADPLSKKFDIDFFRDVPSRNLQALATRSDGRLVAGPTLIGLAGTPPSDLLWCLEPTGDPAKYLMGTGPDGRIVEVTVDAAKGTYTTHDVAKLDDSQVFAVKRLGDGSILAGTSPKGALYLIRNGKTVARALLPVDSIFDLVPMDADTVLAGTGNPGRVYRIDLRKFAGAGLGIDKTTRPQVLAEHGITLLGEIRDRNVRRLAVLANGQIVVGSAPKGNIYTFARGGGAPVILQENRDAEVTDLLPEPNGDFYATVVFSASSGESRITPVSGRPNAPTAPSKDRDNSEATPPPISIDRFSGRSALIWFPANGFPETLTTRSGVAFYRLARTGHTMILAAGDAGDLMGFDLKDRLSLTFAGSISSQLNGLVPIPGAPDSFLVLRNNAPGLAMLDFRTTGPHEAETRRIDLGSPGRLGAFRLNWLRGVAERDIAVDVRVSNGTDEIEGWGPWTAMTLDADGGWRAANLRGRSAKFRLRINAPAATNAPPEFELDRGAVFALPQNRRPQLQDFRVLSPGYGLVVAVEQPPSPVVSLNQLLQGNQHDDDKRKGAFPNSQIVPQPGTQVVLWTVVDPDGDNFTCTFSLRREGDSNWTDVVANTRDSFAQFDTSHLPDGVYFTRLVANETSPRPPAERLSQTFETDDLVIDHTPPDVIAATARQVGSTVVVTVHGRDNLSLLDGIDVTFNNGVHETVEQPVDGIRDGREETFELDEPLARVSNANGVEVTLYDAAGNGTTKRLTW